MKKYIIYILVASSIVMVSGCKDYLNINTNPNQLTVTKPDFILSGALVTSASIKLTDFTGYAGQWAGLYAASGSYSNSGDHVRTYSITQGDGNGIWSDLYLNASNYNYVEQNVSALSGYENYSAICEIMKANCFANLVDVFGNVPYKQALTGFQYLYPKYDNGIDVYAGISNKLDSAVGLIAKAAGASTSAKLPATTDIMFSGDMTKWAKLANTLNLRLMIHESEIGNDAFVTGQLAKIAANGYGFLGAGEDATINPGYSVAVGLQSPLWEGYGESYQGVIGGRDYYRVSTFALSLFQSLQDPRAFRDFRAPANLPGVDTAKLYSSLKAIDFGAPPTTAINSGATSGWGPGLVSSGSENAIFFSASESLFLQAEAAFRGWIGGTPETYFESGITESFRLVGVPSYATAAKTYYTSGRKNADWNASTDKLQAIITQKWIADWGLDALESWDDSRRLGFPVGIPLSADPNKLPSTTNPVRLLYPQTEYSNNTSNVNAQGSISQFTSLIFWDKN